MESEYYAVRTFGWLKIAGHVVQQVYRFGTAQDASAKFHVWLTPELGQGSDHELRPPPEIAYRSPLADEFALGCGKSAGAPVCKVLLRYTNYFIFVYIDIDGGEGDGVQLAEVEPLLRALDERAAAQLGLSHPEPPTAPAPP